MALLACVALGGCFRGGDEPPPPGFPKVDTDYRDPQFPDCPNLEGSYSLTPDAPASFDPRPMLGNQVMQMDGGALLIERGPMGCAFDSSGVPVGQSVAICGLSMILRRAPAEVDAEAEALLRRDPAAYGRWWLVARKGVSLQGSLHLNLYAYERDLERHGPVQDQRRPLTHQTCHEGWLELESGWRDGHDQRVELTRDQTSGLVLRQTVVLSRDEFTVWCGDGCKGIPYSVVSEARWARLAPVERPPMWSLDPQRLPPLARLPRGASPDAGARPQLAVIEPAPRVPPAEDPASLRAFLRVFELEDRIRSGLEEERIDIWRPENGRVLVTGTTPSTAAASAFLRRLQGDAVVARADLVSITVEGDRMRFAILLDLHPE
ncbi:hypothetical protein [Aquimonas voraii]|nr:hypothetical protein [Aquimonas voraii]